MILYGNIILRFPLNNDLPLLRRLCFFGFLFLAVCAFAVVPIQDNSMTGPAAADARLKLITAAESCLGTPYRYAGIDRKGLDCSGLVYLSFREGLKITVPRSTTGLYSWVEKIATADLQPGDLVFFITTGSGVSHVGIYTGDGRFIHSASEGPHTGVIYSTLEESYWKRTYTGAGRALPWDDAAAEAMKTAQGSAKSGESGENSETAALDWGKTGFFAGFAAAWNWGGFFEGAPSVFRGLSFAATAGYKWSDYRIGLELRPEWDRALDVVRLPFTLSFGNDYFQVFTGPAYTFGDPSLDLKNSERSYSGGGEWLFALGVSGAFPPIPINGGVLSIYGELAWQPYFLESGENFSFKPDMTANLRFSTGLRYLWLFKE